MNFLDLIEASKRRDAGMAIAAEAEGDAFAIAAGNALYTICRRQRTVHVDDLLAACPLLRPKHYNAWGAVWMRAVRKGWIKHSGTVRPSADPTKHAHQSPVYISLIFEEGYG